MTDDPAADRWHIDRRIPVALIFALLVQFVGGVWVASSAFERIGQHERRITALETAASSIPERLVRIEVILERLERLQTDKGR